MTFDILLSMTNITIKNLKTFPSTEFGPQGGYSCSVYVDGKRATIFTEYGNGGPAQVDQIDSDLCDKVIAQHKPEKCFDDEIVDSFNDVVPGLVQEYETNKNFKRMCKTKTLFKMKSDSKDTVNIWDVKFSTHIKNALRIKYGYDIVEIINERF